MTGQTTKKTLCAPSCASPISISSGTDTESDGDVISVHEDDTNECGISSGSLAKDANEVDNSNSNKAS